MKANNKNQKRELWSNVEIGLVLVIGLLLLAMSTTYLSHGLTGYLTYGDEGYVDDVSLLFNESSIGKWVPDNQGIISSIRISGEIIGEGTAQIYLNIGNEHLLVYDPGTFRDNMILGLAVAEVENLSSQGSINTRSVPPAYLNGGYWRDQEPPALTGDAVMPSVYSPGVLNITENLTISVNNSQNYTNETINNTGDVIDSSRLFSFECVDTCSGLELSEIQYEFIANLSGARVIITEIAYNVVENTAPEFIGDDYLVVDSETVMNLSKYFSDETDITYLVTTPEYVDVALENEMLTIIADKKYSGTTVLTIVAGDGDKSTIQEIVLNLTKKVSEKVTKPKLKSDKKMFKSGEKPRFELLLPKKVKTGKKFTPASDIVSAKLKDINGKVQAVEPELVKVNDTYYTVQVPDKKAFRAGRYELVVTINGEDESIWFNWGVLAINTHKSMYLPDETAFIGIAVLDDNGNMVCDADVWLEIIGEDNSVTVLSTKTGEISVSEECEVYGVTDLPDYYTSYEVGGAGTYVINLTAATQNGVHSILDYFMVKDPVAFDVMRTGPTRIYPPAAYTMNFTILANEDYSGFVIEKVPVEFEVAEQDEMIVTVVGEEKFVSWIVKFVEGGIYNLSYRFDAADISPYMYILGELSIGSWSEARKWMIASDGPKQLTGVSQTSPANNTDYAPIDNFTFSCALTFGGGSANTANGNWTYCSGAGCTPNTHLTTGTSDLTGTDADGQFSCSDSCTSSQTITANSAGTYNILCGAEDSDGPWMTGGVYTITVTALDSDPNVSSLDYPGDYANLSTQTIQFNFTAYDDNNVTNCTLWGNFTGSWLSNSTIYNPDNDTETNITLTVADGAYLWNVMCYDDNNQADDFDSNNTVTIDSINPVIDLNTPADDSTDSDGSVELNFSVTETNLVNCSLWTNISGSWAFNMTNKTSVISGTPYYFNMTSLPDDLVFIWNVECFDILRSADNNSNYTLTINISQNTLLSVWDKNDSIGGGVLVWVGNTTIFYANFTNTSAYPVNTTLSADAACYIDIYNSTEWTGDQAMTYNQTSSYYEYYFAGFNQSGTHDWNVTCNATGYLENETNDNITVLLSCTTHAECGSSFCSADSTCLAKLANGANCSGVEYPGLDDNSSCISGYCYSDTIDDTGEYCASTETGCVNNGTSYAYNYTLCVGNDYYTCLGGENAWNTTLYDCQDTDEGNDTSSALALYCAYYSTAQTCNSAVGGGCTNGVTADCGDFYYNETLTSCSSTCDQGCGAECDEDSDCASGYCQSDCICSQEYFLCGHDDTNCNDANYCNATVAELYDGSNRNVCTATYACDDGSSVDNCDYRTNQDGGDGAYMECNFSISSVPAGATYSDVVVHYNYFHTQSQNSWFSLKYYDCSSNNYVTGETFYEGSYGEDDFYSGNYSDEVNSFVGDCGSDQLSFRIYLDTNWVGATMDIVRNDVCALKVQYYEASPKSSSLEIWDETDAGMDFAGLTKNRNDSIVFYANHTNTSSQGSINDSTCYVNIYNATEWTGEQLMIFNGSKQLFEYNLTSGIMLGGAHDWYVNCSHDSYYDAAVIDTVLVTSPTSINITSHANESSVVIGTVIDVEIVASNLNVGWWTIDNGVTNYSLANFPSRKEDVLLVHANEGTGTNAMDDSIIQDNGTLNNFGWRTGSDCLDGACLASPGGAGNDRTFYTEYTDFDWTGDTTIQFWIKLDTTSGINIIYEKDGGGDTQKELLCYVDGSSWCNDGPVVGGLCCPIGIAADTWLDLATDTTDWTTSRKFVTFVMDETPDGITYTSYVDGQQERSVASPATSMYHGSGTFKMGFKDWGQDWGQSTFDGAIDEFRITAGARTSSEVLLDYYRAIFNTTSYQLGTIGWGSGNQTLTIYANDTVLGITEISYVFNLLDFTLADLSIFDMTDSLGGSNRLYKGSAAWFYANYADINGNSINITVASDVNCTINIYNGSHYSDNLTMTYNGTSQYYYYYYPSGFNADGSYPYNVSCNASGYEHLSSTDNIFVTYNAIPSAANIIGPNGLESIPPETGVEIKWRAASHSGSNITEDNILRYDVYFSNNSGTDWYIIDQDWGYEKTFNDSTNNKTLQFSNNDNQTLFMDLPSYANITYASVRLSGQSLSGGIIYDSCGSAQYSESDADNCSSIYLVDSTDAIGIGDTGNGEFHDVQFLISNSPGTYIGEILFNVSAALSGSFADLNFIYDMKICPSNVSDLTAGTWTSNCDSGQTIIANDFNLSSAFNGLSGFIRVPMDNPYFMYTGTNYSVFLDYVSGGNAAVNDILQIYIDNVTSNYQTAWKDSTTGNKIGVGKNIGHLQLIEFENNYTSNVTVSLSSNGSNTIFNQSMNFTSINTTAEFETSLQTYISSECSSFPIGENCSVPLVIHSDTEGNITIDEIRVQFSDYYWNTSGYPEYATYKVRIASYDGIHYGANDSSDGDFSVGTGFDIALIVQSLDHPSNGGFFGESYVPFNFTVTDDYNITNCTLQGNFTGNWASNGTVYNVINNTETNISLSLSDGAYLWNVFCYDNASNNDTANANSTFTLDATVPQVRLNTPSNGGTDSDGNVSMNFTAAEANLVNCSLWTNISGTYAFNMTNITPVVSGTPYYFNMTDLSDGLSFIWNVECFDNVRGAVNGSNYSLTVSKVAVSTYLNVTLGLPADNSWNTTSSINFSFTPITATTLDNCSVYTNESGWAIATTNSTPIFNGSINGIVVTFSSDGPYLWNVECYNASSSNMSGNNRTVRVDTTQTDINFTNPTTTAGNYSQTSIISNVTVSAGDLSNINMTLYNITHIANSTLCSESPCNITYLSLSDGVYYLNATATDTAGNINNTETRMISLDNLAPDINFTVPTTAAGTFSQSTIDANVTSLASDLALINLSLYNSSQIVNSSLCVDPYCNITYVSLSDGTYYLNATAIDEVPNINKTETRTIILDATSPVVYLNTPTNASTDTDGNVSLNFTVTETNLVNCSLYTNLSGSWALNITKDTGITSGTPYYFNMTDLSDGLSFIWNVECYDSASNSAFNNSNYTLTIEMVGAFLTVDLSTPSDNSWNTSQTVSFGYYANTSSSFVNCSVYTNESGWSIAASNSSPILNGSLNNISDTFSSEGPYLWNVECYNSSTSATDSANYTIRIDSTTPVVNLNTPANESTNTTHTYLGFYYNVTDINSITSCTLYLNGTSSGTVTSPTKNITNNISLVPGDGYYEWSINCTDLAGNVGASALYTMVANFTEEFSSCMKLDTAGTTYELTDNIDDSSDKKCIEITANNIVLECNGYRIDGNDAADYGIFISRAQEQTTNITIRNCIISDWDQANIYVLKSSDNVFEHLVTKSSPNKGLDIKYSYNNQIVNATVENNTVGIQLYYAGNHTIVNSSIIGSFDRGVYIYRSEYSQFYNNFFNSTVNIEVTVDYENYWNVTKTLSTNIISGNWIAGNYWANPSGTGYSEDCADSIGDGICDNSYNISSVNIDYHPLSIADAVDPNVTIFTALNNTFVNGNLSLMVTATDNVGILYVIFEYKNSTMGWSLLCNDTGSPYSCIWDTSEDTDASEGYDVRATAYDYAGNYENDTKHYIVDRDIPYVEDVTVVYPSGQASIRNGQVIVLKVNITDSPIVGAGMNTTEVDLTNLNGSGNMTMNFESGALASEEWSWWNISVNLSGSSTGTRLATIYAYDNATPDNNLRASEAFMVTVDNEVPTYSNLRHTPDQPNGTEVQFLVDVFDNYDLSGYIFSSNISGSWQNDSLAAISGDAKSIFVTKNPLTGNHSYKFFIYDDAGNVNETIVQTVEVLAPAPEFTVYLNTPIDDAIFNVTTLNLSFWYENGVADNCSLYLDGVENETLNNPVNYSVYNFSKSVANGSHDWFVRCIENITNDTYDSDVREFNITLLFVDSVSVISAQDPIESGIRNISVNFTVSDENGITDLNHSTATVSVNYSDYLINGTCSNNTIDDSTVEYNCSFSMLYYYPAGVWNINVSVKDNSQNYQENFTTSLTYNELAAVQLLVSSMSFGDVNLGDSDINASNPFVVNNTGNKVFNTVNITAYDLMGVTNSTYFIGAGNMTVNTTDSAVGYVLSNNSMVEISTGSILANSYEELFFYIDLPSSGLIAQDYNSLVDWMVSVD